MIGTFIERYQAKINHGSGGGGGGGGGGGRSSLSNHGKLGGGRGQPYASDKAMACVAAAGVLAGLSYVPHPVAKAAVIGGSMIAAAACQ